MIKSRFHPCIATVAYRGLSCSSMYSYTVAYRGLFCLDGQFRVSVTDGASGSLSVSVQCNDPSTRLVPRSSGGNLVPPSVEEEVSSICRRLLCESLEKSSETKKMTERKWSKDRKMTMQLCGAGRTSPEGGGTGASQRIVFWRRVVRLRRRRTKRLIWRWLHSWIIEEDRF